MRSFWIFIFFLSVAFGPAASANAAQPRVQKSKPSLAARTRAKLRSIKENASDALQNSANAVTAALGRIDKCDDSGTISEDDIRKIDACTRANFRGNLGDITRLAYFSEQLILNDLATGAEASVDCHLPFLVAYDRSMKAGKPTTEANEMNQRAFAKYFERQTQIADAYRKYKEFTDWPPGSRGEHPTAGALEAFQKTKAELSVKLNALTVDIPLGTTESVRQALFKLAEQGVRDLASFAKGYSSGVSELKTAMLEFKDELRDGKQETGGIYFYNFEKMPQFREELMLSDRYDTALVELGATPNARKNLLCRRDAEFVRGRSRASAGLTALSILSIAASFGTGAVVVGAAEGAAAVTVTRTAQVALQMGIAASDVALAAGATLSACSEKTSIIPAASNTCTDKEAFEGIIKRADASNCYATLGVNGATLALPIAGVAFGATTKAATRFVDSKLPANPHVALWRLEEAGNVAEATKLRKTIEDELRLGEIAEVDGLEWQMVQKGGVKIPRRRSKLGGVTGARLVTLSDGTRAVWKPAGGSRWASGSAEVGVYDVDKALGTSLVPPTVSRELNGKPGTLQLFVDGFDTNVLRESTPEHLQWFDSLVRNADRHADNYRTIGGRPVAIDHGASLSTGAINSKHRKSLRFDQDIDDLMAESKRIRGEKLPPRESLPTPRDKELAAVIEQYRDLRYNAPTAMRLKASNLLPPEEAYKKLAATNESSWREILAKSGTSETAIAGFLARRKSMIERVEKAKRLWGDDILRHTPQSPVAFPPSPRRPIPYSMIGLVRKDMKLTDDDLLKPLTPGREIRLIDAVREGDKKRRNQGRGESFFDD